MTKTPNLTDENREILKAARKPERYVTIYMNDTDLRMMNAMMEKLSISRSGLVRAALTAYQPIVAKLLP